jgi:ABC-type transport system substrate-binding protein
VPNSPASYAQYIRQITGVEVVDDHTIRFRTGTPFPLMPVFLSTFTIVSEAHGQDATTEDYNSGKAAIGTGPYRLVSYMPNAEVVLEQNPDYWGGAEPWSKVTFQIIDSNGPRVAALLAGDVDVIDTVPATDLRWRCSPSSWPRIVFRHLLPNCLPPVIVIGAVQTANAIALEATLSFLGIGLPQTQPSLGLLIANGFGFLMSGLYWISMFPGLALVVTIVAINLVGDRLRTVLNPRLSR